MKASNGLVSSESACKQWAVQVEVQQEKQEPGNMQHNSNKKMTSLWKIMANITDVNMLAAAR